ncbi:MAG: aminotransferase class I/II-fold pyridoxal phosphate-dependent enzyme, partial [Hyphomicrobiaceae bacterium]|nr:aminotransferase class I/II-fold pyridoxal phosphate-dependent enzyme [Hyphomicrobiaceae bacterium]
MAEDKLAFLREEMANLQESKLFVHIRTIESPADAWMMVDGRKVLNFCTNNYLGLANHPKIKEAARKAISEWGVGPAAVRTIAGTQSLHLQLEQRLAGFKEVEDALYVQSGLCANLAAIPCLVGKDDVIFSDRLNHASIIDGCRLARAKIIVYEHCDPADCERVVREHIGDYGRGLLVTDGVFSMDGDVAPLEGICDLADRYDAMVMIDDCHATGFLGDTGRGTPEYTGTAGRIDIITSTLGKALGGGVFPVSAVVADRAIMGLFTPGTHGSTFGGNPLGMAVAREALKVLVEEKLIENSAKLGPWFMEKLGDLPFKSIKKVRGRGLFIGLVLDRPARPYCEALMAEGILCKETHENV